MKKLEDKAEITKSSKLSIKKDVVRRLSGSDLRLAVGGACANTVPPCTACTAGNTAVDCGPTNGNTSCGASAKQSPSVRTSAGGAA